MENRRRYCSTLLTLVVKLCSCSPAKEAEYFTTQTYSLPCTRSFSAAARTPGCWLLHGSSCSTALSRNSAGAWFHGRAEIHPPRASSSSTVLASAAVPLSNTSRHRIARDLMVIQQARDSGQCGGEFLGVGPVAGVNVM